MYFAVFDGRSITQFHNASNRRRQIYNNIFLFKEDTSSLTKAKIVKKIYVNWNYKIYAHAILESYETYKKADIPVIYIKYNVAFKSRRSKSEINVVCCVGRVEIQIEI